MKKILLFNLLIVALFAESKAQYDADALRFSRMQHLGTARFNSMGGAFGALGGDFSSAYLNPAGLGVYRSSEFSFSPGFLFNSTESSFRGNEAAESRFNFNMGNIGYVGHYSNGESGWKDYSFSIGYNRVSNFASRTFFSGTSTANSEFLASSLIDDYVADLNNANIVQTQIENRFPFGVYQAYYTYLINPIDTNPSTTIYERGFLGDESIQQKNTTLNRGGIGETFIGFGGNYEDKFYLGGSIGFQSLRFESERRYEENILYTENSNPDPLDIAGFVQNEELIISGLGVNLKLGIIYKITDMLRLGATVHSPTFYSLSEEFTMKIKSESINGEIIEVPIEEQAVSEFDYRLNTPVRLMGSLAYVFAKNGLISMDYEYVNYRKARLRQQRAFSFDYDFEVENQAISENFASTHNIRLGGEYRVDPFVLRAGIKYEDNPYASHVSVDGKRFTYSMGAGYRSENYFLDIAYMLSKTDQENYPYSSVEVPAYVEETNNYIVISTGFRF